jgi:protein-S-isoprenylcysteine O-methyltransferase Ste14
MPGLALALLGVYFLLAFAGRVLVQLRLTGSTGINGVTGRPGSAEWVAGVLLLAAVVTVPLGAALDLAGTVGPVPALDGGAAHAAGIALFALGCAGTLYAQLAMGASWRIGVREEDQTALVTGGPFALVRNPIFSAMVAALAGVVLLSPNVVSLGGLALLVVSLELQVRVVEEPHLLRTQPAYPAYAVRVGRFVPGVGRLQR